MSHSQVGVTPTPHQQIASDVTR